MSQLDTVGWPIRVDSCLLSWFNFSFKRLKKEKEAKVRAREDKGTSDEQALDCSLLPLPTSLPEPPPLSCYFKPPPHVISLALFSPLFSPLISFPLLSVIFPSLLLPSPILSSPPLCYTLHSFPVSLSYFSPSSPLFSSQLLPSRVSCLPFSSPNTLSSFLSSPLLWSPFFPALPYPLAPSLLYPSPPPSHMISSLPFSSPLPWSPHFLSPILFSPPLSYFSGIQIYLWRKKL